MKDKKRVFDSLHRFIHISQIESDLIHSKPFHRLFYIHQLGAAYLVYPGAAHKRFEHSLGVMEVATKIYDHITDTIHPKLKGKLPERDDIEHCYYREIIRLAALCHDLGHLPFSHTAEKEILGDAGHEKWTVAIIQSKYLMPLWEKVAEKYSKKTTEDVCKAIIKMAVGKEKLESIFPDKFEFTDLESVFSEIITADLFGADRIDYLLRDSKCSGLSYGLFDYHQLIESLQVVPMNDNSMKLGIDENGVEASEALILARHFMHRRLYHYSSVKACNFHLTRFMKHLYEKADYTSDIDTYLKMTDSHVLASMYDLSYENTISGPHIDAKALLSQIPRFKAHHIQNLSEEAILSFQKNYSIPTTHIGWEIRSNHNQNKYRFPLIKDGELSSIDESLHPGLSSIQAPSWVFIENEFNDKIGKHFS